MRLRNNTQSIRPEQKMRRWMPEEVNDAVLREEETKMPKIYGPKKASLADSRRGRERSEEDRKTI